MLVAIMTARQDPGSTFNAKNRSHNAGHCHLAARDSASCLILFSHSAAVDAPR